MEMASRNSVLVYPAICGNKVLYSNGLLNLSFTVCSCNIFKVEDVKSFGIRTEKGYNFKRKSS